MKIAFRADASLQIGSGHVMRCLTLADALRAQGAECHFISRAHPGHLMEVIHQRGFKVNSLLANVEYTQAAIRNIATTAQNPQPNQSPEPTHAAWLGSTWQADATDTASVLASLQPDWLVVDHYALEQRWEAALAPRYKKLMVIDDLADRAHHCNLLLDQNLGRQQQDYVGLVPTQCKVLAGPHFALLRPEFAALRPYSLQRRQEKTTVERLLITMGGVDQNNVTAQVLQTLKTLKTSVLPLNCRITVVMGLSGPWLQSVRELAAQMPWPTEVVVNVNDMAQRMADSDLAIGAAGSTSWERCCLGLPTLMVVLADNQKEAAEHLQRAGAARYLAFSGLGHQSLHDQLQYFMNSPEQLRLMVTFASAITNGLGFERVVAAMEMALNQRTEGKI